MLAFEVIDEALLSLCVITFSVIEIGKVIIGKLRVVSIYDLI
jgi:hypothetical protein